MNTYLAQEFTSPELKVKCSHKYRQCDCGNVHCIGACRYTQGPAGEFKVLCVNLDETEEFKTFLLEAAPDKRAPCCFCGGEFV